MRKSILVIALFLMGTTAFGQDSTSTTKWNFGGNFSVGGLFSIIGNNGPQERFTHHIGFGGQLLAEYQKKKFNVGFGINYSERATIYNGIPGVVVEEEKWDIRLYNIGVPLSIKYYALQKEKANFFIALNTDFDFTIYHTSQLTYKVNGETFEDNNSSVNNGAYNYFNPTIGISFGLELKLRNNFVRIEPYVNFAPVHMPVFFEDVYNVNAGLKLGFFSSKVK